MSPVPPTDVETPPAMESKEAGGVADQKAAVGDVPPATMEGTAGAPTTPAPTKVDAYKHRGIRSKQSAMDLVVPVLLRILTAVFSLIAFAIIASDNTTVRTPIDAAGDYLEGKEKFSSFFFFSYLLTANVIAFTYALVTIGLAFIPLKSSVSYMVFAAIFALDQMVSYLLISASTSAATGSRLYKQVFDSLGSSTSGSFFAKANAAIAFSFLAFFVLATAALFSGLRVVRRQ
ncbi:unnamed protein product [Calypogeia fissa]